MQLGLQKSDLLSALARLWCDSARDVQEEIGFKDRSADIAGHDLHVPWIFLLFKMVFLSAPKVTTSSCAPRGFLQAFPVPFHLVSSELVY